MGGTANINNWNVRLSERGALDSLEFEQFLLTPEAYRTISPATVLGGNLAQPDRPAPTFDAVVETALAGNEPLEIVLRQIPVLGAQWIVTLKNYPHVAVFVSGSKSECETVASTRKLL
jgi:hypothetical protein